MKKIFLVSTVLLVAGLGYGVYGSFQGQDLSDINGYAETDRQPGNINCFADVRTFQMGFICDLSIHVK